MIYSIDIVNIPRITDVFTQTRDTDWQISDKSNILLSITDGSCLISVDGDEFTASRGDVVFIPASHPYSRTPVNDTMCTFTYLRFASENVPSMQDGAILTASLAHLKSELDLKLISGGQFGGFPNRVYLKTRMRGAYNEKYIDLLDKITAEFESLSLMTHITTSAYLLRILALLSESVLYEIEAECKLASKNKFPEKLARAVEYISKNYTEKITLEDIASHISVSRDQVIRYFNDTLKSTPIAYINSYRIAHAKELILKRPDLTMKEIAAETGFESQYYFSRVFRKVTGESPATYKSRLGHFMENSKTNADSLWWRQ